MAKKRTTLLGGSSDSKAKTGGLLGAPVGAPKRGLLGAPVGAPKRGLLGAPGGAPKNRKEGLLSGTSPQPDTSAPNYSSGLGKSLFGPEQNPELDWDTITKEAISFLEGARVVTVAGKLDGRKIAKDPKLKDTRKRLIDDNVKLIEDAKKEVAEVLSGEGWDGFDLYWTVGERIKLARLSAKLTQQQLADALGVTQSAVTEWEKSRAFPKVDRIEGIAVLTGVETKYILIGDMTPAQVLAMTALRFGSNILADKGIGNADPDIAMKTGMSEFNSRRFAADGREDFKTFRQTQAATEANLGALGNLQRGGGIASLLNARRLTDNQSPLDLPIRETLPHPDGEFFITDNVNRYLSRPKGLQYNGQAYALYVYSHSATPVFNQGDVLVVDPTRPSAVYDDVIVKLKFKEDEPGHKACIGKLVFQDNKEVIILHYARDDDVSIGTRQIEEVLRIMPWNEVLGW